MPKFFLAIDIECVGSKWKSHIPAVGMAVGNAETQEVMDVKLFKILAHETDAPMSPRCKAEFWDKQEDGKLFDSLQKDAMEAKMGWTDVNCYLNSVYDFYGKDLEIRSDNPEFDLGRLNDMLYRHAGRLYPLRYQILNDSKVKYISIEDVGSQMSTLPPEFKKFIEKGAPPHPHRPDQDATHILYLAMQIYKYFKV